MSPIDEEARRDIAVQTVRLDEHEKACAERWSENRKAMAGFDLRLRWILGFVITGQGALILLLLAQQLQGN